MPTPLAIRPRSCQTPSRNAALPPTTDHRSGTTVRLVVPLARARANIAKVKIVVGQGTPNVGLAG
jgi:hypothetical protein